MPRLELVDISKQYPSVKANDHVNLTVQPGEIHAILGENGAGKSTLMKIIYGAIRPDEGEMRWNGQRVSLANPAEARQLGVSMVFQHFSLFDTLTAAENVWLGLDRSSKLDEVIHRIREVSGAYGLELDPMRPVHTLSVGERQRVEIVRALLTDPKLLILDEPTSVLTPQAVESLFVALRKLAAEGCAILYISHKLHEIRELCSACTVMRAGRVTGKVDPRQETNASLSRLMIGAEPPKLVRRGAAVGEPRLSVRALNLPALDQFGVTLQNIDLEVRAGEITGIAGVSGNGQKELLAALSGEDLRTHTGYAGSIHLDGQEASALTPVGRRRLGLHFVPEERLGRGAVPTMSLAQNLLLTRDEAVRGPLGWINREVLASQAQDIIAHFNVKAGGPQALAKSLSGGNLQKFIMGREIEALPKVLIVSQPTWGVDVGAAAQIRGAMLDLAGAGCAVLVVSEELDELFEICDRLHVLAHGCLSPSIDVADATVEQVGIWMSGLWPGAAAAKDTQEAPHAAA